MEEYGVHRLEQVVRAHLSRRAKEIVDRIVDETRTYSGREGYDDDFTLVLVKREPA